MNPKRFLLFFSFLAFLNPSAWGQEMDIALLAGDVSSSNVDDVQTVLEGTNRFASVTQINVTGSTPDLNTLSSFDALLVWSNSAYSNAYSLGDVLADYVDQGGGVVVMVFGNTDFSPNHYLRGRWETGGYAVMEPNMGYITGPASIGTRYSTSHPVLDNVNSFDGGSLAFRGLSTTLSPGGSRVADWTDGQILVCVDESHAAPRVDLNFYPLSDGLNPSYWDRDSDGDLLMANALEWTAGGGLPTLDFIEILPGQYLTIEIRRVAADSDVVTVISSRGPGPTQTPFAEVQVTFPWFQTPLFPADENGVVNFTTTLPAGASGRVIFGQALEFRIDGSVQLSNPVAVPIP